MEKKTVLQLQPLLEQCCRDGAYDDIDYTQDPVPPLDPEHMTWAGALLREAGSRT